MAALGARRVAIGHKRDTANTPAPGCYAPLEPRLKDLMKLGSDASGQAGRWGSFQTRALRCDDDGRMK